MRKTSVAALAALTVLTAPGTATAAAGHRPVLKTLTYKQLGTGWTAKAEYTAEVRLYTHAPSVELEIRGRHGNETSVSVLFPRSYRPGLDRLRVKDLSVGPGTYTVSLVVNLPGDHHMNGANRGTLVINAAGDGQLTGS